MRKQEFLEQLKKGLAGMPKSEIEERLTFYSEMIDDYMEEGLSEESAVAKIGSVEEVVSQVIADIPLTKLVREKIKIKRRLKDWEILLIVLGFPVWFSLLVGALSIVFSLYVALWSVVVSLWAAFGALIGSGVGVTLGSLLFLCMGNAASGFVFLGGGLVCIGLAIFSFYGCKAVTKGVLWLTKSIVVGIKRSFMKKEKYNA